MPEFGIRLPVSGPVASTEAILRTAGLAENLGFDSIWVHDFIGWTKEMDRAHVSCGSIDLIQPDTEPVMFETITLLAYLSGVTTNITIGSAILCTPYRNPVVQAKQIATIDVLSGGRLVLGAGVGALKRIGADFEVVGVPRNEKYERTAEYLLLMREIWENELPSFAGSFVQMPETEINPKPVQNPMPIWMGGKGDKSLSIAARVANGWIPTWLDAPGYKEAIARLFQALESQGRNNEPFVIAKECYGAIDTNSHQARAFSQPTFETFTQGFTVRTYEDAIASALLGDPDEMCEQIDDYVAAGVDHFEIKFIYLSEQHLAEQMQLFAERVIPEYVSSKATA